MTLVPSVSKGIAIRNVIANAIISGEIVLASASMKISNSDLPLGFLVNTVADHIRQATICALDGIDITVVELGVLWLIDLSPGETQASYARFQRRDLTTFGRIVDKLESQQFLSRNCCADDRRANHLSLTDEGRAILKVGKKIALKTERDLFAVLGKEADAFRNALVQILGL
jgi:DNA-binding MarR family transcriptional regulator